MARRAAAATSTLPTEAIEATSNEESTVTDTIVEAVEAEATEAVETDAPTESAVIADEVEVVEEVPVDLTAFLAAVATTIEGRDESTGDVAPALAVPTVTEYRSLDGAKAKAQARKAVELLMFEAMQASDINLARAYMQVTASLKAGSSSKPKADVVPKAPVDPTENFVERIAGLAITQALVGENVPEGVNEAWAEAASEKANTAIEAARALYTWSVSTDEEKGDAPEAEPFVIAAVKLALGKAAKVGGSKAKAASTFTGERRSVANHITEAFAEVEVGTFLSVAEIQKFASVEYGDDKPSAGAVSARLKEGATVIPGIQAAADAAGKRGAIKVDVEA